MNQEPNENGGELRDEENTLEIPRRKGGPGRPPRIDLNDPNPDDITQELFGPGSGIFHSPEEDESAPEELLQVFEEYGLSEVKYKCVLKEIDSAGGSAIVKTPSSLDYYPSVDWITQNCGPGKYQLVFSWKYRDSDGKYKPKTRPVRISISDKSMGEYLDYQRKLKIKMAAQARQDIQQAKLDKMLDSDLSELTDADKRLPAAYVDPLEAGKKFVQQTMESAKLLGLGRQEPAQSPFDLGKLLSIVGPLIPVLLDFLGKQAERSEARMREFITLLTSTNAANQAQMLEMVKTASGANAGRDAVKQYQEMLQGVIDIKTEIGGMGKKSVADRIFELLEGIAPVVAQLVAMPKAQAINDPRVQAAQLYTKFSPDFQAIKNDPEEQARLLAEMDAYYGWEQTDQILGVMKLFERPPTAPRRTDQRYAQGDPRNTVSGEDGETADFEASGAAFGPGSTGRSGDGQGDGEGLGED